MKDEVICDCGAVLDSYPFGGDVAKTKDSCMRCESMSEECCSCGHGRASHLTRRCAVARCECGGFGQPPRDSVRWLYPPVDDPAWKMDQSARARADAKRRSPGSIAKVLGLCLLPLFPFMLLGDILLSHARESVHRANRQLTVHRAVARVRRVALRIIEVADRKEREFGAAGAHESGTRRAVCQAIIVELDDIEREVRSQ